VILSEEDIVSDAISRRDFFRKDFLKMFFPAESSKPLTEAEKRQESIEEYFKSPIHSYPLLQEMPWDFLLAEAKSKGIPVEGRSKNEIAKDIFLKSNSA
jgi:hypothetical protein